VAIYRVHCQVRQEFSFCVAAANEEHARSRVSHMNEDQILVHTADDINSRRTITIEKVDLEVDFNKEE
jgi:hypothetical protein